MADDGEDNATDRNDAFAAERERMARQVADRVDDDRIVEALEAVPRHAFVPSDRREQAYRDRPLPIGEGQTISAPHMVAIMADRLEVARGDAVLEVGTGRGYHAAVTAELVGQEHVYSVEYDASLAAVARETLAEAGYGAIGVRVGDGRDGWAEHAPYDAAYLTCAARSAPDDVVEQLRPGGRLLAPIGERRQRLVSVEVGDDGGRTRTEHEAVRFVRMRG